MDMEREPLESLLIDYNDGKLGEEEHARVDQMLVNQPEVFRTCEQLKEVLQLMKDAGRMEPSSALQHGFDKLLQEELQKQPHSRIIPLSPAIWRVAAAVTLLVLGGSIGFWVSQQHNRASELEAVRREMAATKQMLMTMLDNQQSASQRVMGATVAYNDVSQADDEIANALVNALNKDENTNVRMAALEALSKFYHQPNVRKALIASLNQQNDPVVQITLIRLMVEMKEKGVTQQLEQITTDDEALPAVQDEAHAGLLKLL
jgi:anti-sigma factor RsiW